MKTAKNKIEIIITLGLVLILIFLIYRQPKGPKTKEVISQQAVSTQIGIGKFSAREENIKKIKGLNWARDPFLFGEARTGDSGLVLNGIVWDEKSPFAIIDGNVVRVGDEVAASRVVDIQKERVILSKDSGMYELNLQQRGRE